MRFKTKLKQAAMVSLLAGLAGCATNETDPTKVSWGDIIGMQVSDDSRLNQHLEKRQQELENLRQKAHQLDQRLWRKQRELNRLDAEASQQQVKTRAAQKKLAEYNRQIETKKAELTAAINKAKDLKQKEADLNARLATFNSDREAREELMRYQIEIEKLENEVVTLENAIDRILLVRAKYATENQ